MRQTTRLAILLAAACSTGALAQKTATLKFEQPGERSFWTGPAPLDASASAAMPSTQTTVAVHVEKAGPTDHVFVWDGITGNLASRPVAKALGGWTVADTDYKAAYRVAVRVERQGKPVASAAVTLVEPGRKRMQMLAPPMRGVVSFYGVAFGPIKVSASYSAGGQTKSSQTVLLDLKRVREDPEPIVTLAISDPVETVAGGEAEAPKGAAAPSPEPSVLQRVGGVLVYLIGAAAAVGAGFLLLRYVQRQPEKVEQALGKLGVKLPDEGTEGDVPPQAAPKAPEPIQPIVLGAPAVAPAASGAVANPRLVGEDGSVFLIPEGESTVGREATDGCLLAGETTVSRVHATLVRSGDEVRLRDAGSTNGTFVNGARIDAEVFLRPGDDVQFGAVRRRYEV